MERIQIGLNSQQKRSAVQNTLNEYKDVDRIFVFYGDKEQPNFDFDGIETIYTPWSETEMYRTFYPLLGQPYKGQEIPAITDKSLLIVDEMLVDRNRGCLKQNCTMHFMRVSKRRLIFNWLPFIEDADDFMILLDFAYPDKYKKRKFESDILKEIKLKITKRLPEIKYMLIESGEHDQKAYEERKEELFDNLGNKDPDTIPRDLILLAGKVKFTRTFKASNLLHPVLCRNRRLKADNIITYADRSNDQTIFMLDPTYKRLDLIRFLKRNDIKNIVYLRTMLPVDKVYWDDLDSWKNRMERFYGTANLY